MKQSEWAVYEISDSDEPGDYILVGMRHRDFDGVLLLLLPDGEPDATDWYGTPRTNDGRPTRPLLLFFRGAEPDVEDALAWLEDGGLESLCAPTAPLPTTFEAYPNENETTCTVDVHLNFPPYPWLEEARLGMEMGRYFDCVELSEWAEPTETHTGSYTFRFYSSGAEAYKGKSCSEIEDDDLPY